MSQQATLDLAHGALIVALSLGGPALFVILTVGIVVSAFQAMTQINELTLSFVPKLIALGVLLILLGPWMLQTAVDYTVGILGHLATVAR